MPKKMKNNKPKRKQIKRKKQNKRPKSQRRPRGNGGISLSSCAAHYGVAVGAPFAAGAIGACVPTFPARPSFKTHARLFGNVYVGESGFGFIAVAPTVCNNTTYAWVSLPSFSLTQIDVTAIGVTPLIMSANSYASGAFLGTTTADASTARIVSVGIRIRYIGTELSRGGVIYGLVTPNHDNVNGLNIDRISGYRECIRRPVTREWTTLVVTAIDMDECEYPDSSGYWIAGQNALGTINMLYPYSSLTYAAPGLTGNGAPVACFMVTGPIDNSFEVEIIQHQEIVGRAVQSVVTPSHSDAQGTSMIVEAKGVADVMAGSNTVARPYEQNFAASVIKTMKSMKQKAVSAARLVNTLSEGAKVATETWEALSGLSGAISGVPVL